MRLIYLATVLGWGYMTVFLTSFGFAQDLPPIGTEEGQMYPDFRLPTLDGEVRALSDFREKKVLLFHFASW